MDLLARREYSFHELADKLGRKFCSGMASPSSELEAFEQLLFEQLGLLVADNLQSDQRFVESFVNGRKASGKGPLRIRQELKQKQLSAELISAAIDDNDDEWRLLAQQVYNKKFGGGEAKDYRDKSRRFRFMLYRGFPPSLLGRLIK